MLKDKSCYASDRVYAVNYFFHKADVADYCIDPLLGSFMRIVYPPKDMPTGGSKMYYRPQFLFMTRNDRSRLYELEDAGSLANAVFNLLTSERSERPLRAQLEVTGKLLFGSEGGVEFKDVDMRFQRLLSRPSSLNCDHGPNNEHLTKERYIQGLENLLHGLNSALVHGQAEPRDIITMGGEMMMTLKRPDTRFISPIVVTARKFESRKDAYVILHSDKQRVIFPADKAEEMFHSYFTAIESLAQHLISYGGPGDGAVRLIRGDNGIADGTMEYVNIRAIGFESGPNIHVIMNSDRYPGNTKFSFIYDEQFVRDMKVKLTAFAREFKEICSK